MTEFIESAETSETSETAERKLILSIDAAVGGGSVSVLENQREIAGWSGTQRISKAEEVLEQTARLLRENRITKNQIRAISVSKNVGSSTGQKIGLALAKGLAKSFGCDLFIECVLAALLLEIKQRIEGEYVVAVDGGNDYLWWRVYDLKNKIFSSETESPQYSTAEELSDKLTRINFRQIVFSARDAANINPVAAHDVLRGAKDNLVFCEKSPAKLIGIKAASNASDNELGISNRLF